MTIPGIYFRRFKKPRGRALANSGSLFFFFLSPPCPPRVNQASTERKASVHLKDITLKHTVCTEENPNPQLSRKPLSFTPCVATVKAQPQEELQHPMSRHQASLGGGLSPQGRLGSAERDGEEGARQALGQLRQTQIQMAHLTEKGWKPEGAERQEKTEVEEAQWPPRARGHEEQGRSDKKGKKTKEPKGRKREIR